MERYLYKRSSYASDTVTKLTATTLSGDTASTLRIDLTVAVRLHVHEMWWVETLCEEWVVNLSLAGLRKNMEILFSREIFVSAPYQKIFEITF